MFNRARRNAKLQGNLLCAFALEQQKNHFQFLMALVHNSKSRRNPSVGSEKLCRFVTLRHAQVGHFVESHTAD